MKKAWLTSITVAGIAGSGGAAFAGVNAIQHASAESAPATNAQAEAGHHARTVSYQIGDAGMVTLNSDGTILTVTESIASSGWSLVSGSAAAAHVEVQFTDGQQLVTFLADQVGDDIVVSLTNVEAPGATTVAPAPMSVTIISQSGGENQPKPAPKPPTVTTVHANPPATHTSAPSSHEDDEDEDEDDEHEDEGDDD